MSSPQLSKHEIMEIYESSFFDLMHRAHGIHRENFSTQHVELCKLLSIKTGACPEDCKYCTQSGHYKTDLKKEKLMDKELILAVARKAKESGARRFCMGCAYRNIPAKALDQLCESISAVKAMGMETCLTAGMLTAEDCVALKDSGLDYYNHNLDTSPEYYAEMVTTRTYQDRIDTLQHVADSEINVCCGGIIGMGESQEDRVGLIHALANLPKPPDTLPINLLVPIPGTPFEEMAPIDDFEVLRFIATARIVLPKSVLRLTAGRYKMSESLQAWCYFIGCNSVFIENLLTTPLKEQSEDMALFEKLNLEVVGADETLQEVAEPQACTVI